MSDNKQVDNIRKFLATAYGDEQLAALLAHTESGRLSFHSCCCLIGIPNAPHALQCAGVYIHEPISGRSHVWAGRKLPFGKEAEHEFLNLGWCDSHRRKALLPLIREEMNQRDFNRLLKQCDEMSATVSEGTELLAEARENLSEALKAMSVSGEFAEIEARPIRVSAAENAEQPTPSGQGHAPEPVKDGYSPAQLLEVERKYHCTQHRLRQEAAERWPGESDE